jgi:hypothetical protein
MAITDTIKDGEMAAGDPAAAARRANSGGLHDVA